MFILPEIYVDLNDYGTMDFAGSADGSTAESLTVYVYKRISLYLLLHIY
jgi:hypothetical protein